VYKSIRSLFPLSDLEKKFIHRKKSKKEEEKKEIVSEIAGQVEAEAQTIKTRINCND
jgi:hypothetical protein